MLIVCRPAYGKMASIRSSSSLEKSTFRKAFRLSSSCATELAPIMTDVTSSSFKTQAKDISANVCPRSAATRSKALIFSKIASVNTSRFRNRPCAIRESSGTPCR